jgi:quercetin dioxygenase-like cupin family protein
MGFEFLYVLAEELELRHGDQRCVLGAGDAVYFDSNTPHSYQCAGEKPSGAIIVTMQQPATGQPMPLRPAGGARNSATQNREPEQPAKEAVQAG